MSTLIDSLRGKLIVSCQAYPGEPLRNAEAMAEMARAAEIGGAAAIRAQGLSDISAITSRVEIPVIGLWKDGHDGVYITPTARHAKACVFAGADIVALDATARPRPRGESFEDIVGVLHAEQVAVMADCGSIEDALRAEAAGCEIISTTLAGYTPDRPKTEGPDFEFLDEVVSRCTTPVICEGRIHTPALAAEALRRGAWSVVVGTAITHPTSITQWFVTALEDEN